MSLELLKNQLPDFAKDIKLNLGSVLSIEGAPDLSLKQIHLIALAAAFASQQAAVIAAVLANAEPHLDAAAVNAAKSAATIMAMNNIYYRFVHLVQDKSYASMPARLRMNVLANSGIDKKDFELCCLAVSALNGCGMCMDAHAQELTKAGVSKLGIQSCVRIAAVLHAAGISISIGG
jgi:alkyl hydroperoxide reductase subunit D